MSRISRLNNIVSSLILHDRISLHIRYNDFMQIGILVKIEVKNIGITFIFIADDGTICVGFCRKRSQLATFTILNDDVA